MRRVLIANRGEIAIRAMRACRELGLTGVAVFTPEDRDSMHRRRADVSVELGAPGRPVRGYLDAELLVATALEADCDAVYPGYGFLSESATFARAVTAAGLRFVGPPPAVLDLTGDKVTARATAISAGLPVLRGSQPVANAEQAYEAASELGGPVFLKAAGGGGGRGLRRLAGPEEVAQAFDSARREAEAAFGDPTLFVEEALDRARHIEVQILADHTGEVVHLYDRDCSVQRRHQKVVEIAPAIGVAEDLRRVLWADAIAFARAAGYENAGTVEFLVAGDRHVFIEMNPRIQVEHTVTEETTDVDLVVAQLAIAAGATLAELGLTQDRIISRGVAVQCRLTTEDPAADFRPSTGRILEYRSPGGPGIRLDGATYVGAEVLPYFDSLLVKLTARGKDLPTAARRARRALSEFRVRGVSTNVSFLSAVLEDEDFIAGQATTSLLALKPHLLRGGQRDEVTGLLTWMAERTVNPTPGPALVHTRDRLPTELPPLPEEGPRQRLDRLGPRSFSEWMRSSVSVLVADTTMRDAHQSLLATRVRTIDLVSAAPATCALMPGLLALECWGGATFDTSLRFLHEDPWDRLAQLRQAAPTPLLQMLLRGRNALGYTPYPDAMVDAFVLEARSTGIDVFRIFDALNDPEQIRPALEAVLTHGGLAEAAICYTGHLQDPAEQIYTLDYYLRIADAMVSMGAHVLCIKDMAGLLRPAASAVLVKALRDRFDLPVRLHTHDTAGGQIATLLAAIDVGVDGVDAAAAPMSGGGSQPSLGALVAALSSSERRPDLELSQVTAMEPYWESIRDLYSPFESGLRSPTATVYRNEIPGGQMSNLRQQAIALGLGDRFPEVCELYARANEILGRPVKVTPTSKVVGDLALWMASTGTTPEDLLEHPRGRSLPASVLGYLRGELGVPAGGFLQPFTDIVTEGLPSLPAPVLSARQQAWLVDPAERRRTLNDLLFPVPARDQREHHERYGDLSLLPTHAFLYGLHRGKRTTFEQRPGSELEVELQAVSEIDSEGMRSVHLTVNAQPWSIMVRDTSAPTDTTAAHEKAGTDSAGHVAAGIAGILTVLVTEGQTVKAHDKIAIIEAMKMEAPVLAPHDGKIARLPLVSGVQTEVDDLVAVVVST